MTIDYGDNMGEVMNGVEDYLGRIIDACADVCPKNSKRAAELFKDCLAILLDGYCGEHADDDELLAERYDELESQYQEAFSIMEQLKGDAEELYELTSITVEVED